MVKVRTQSWTLRLREISPSLICPLFLFCLSFRASATTWYLNDSETKGDRFTQDIGSDSSGAGSEAKPFRTIAHALQSAKDGDILQLDTGEYVIPFTGSEPTETVPCPIHLSNLTVAGAGPEKTRLSAHGKAGLVFLQTRGVQLRDFSIKGGDSSLLLDHCSDFNLTRIWTQNSRVFGILIKDSIQVKMAACRTELSRFRGVQLRRSHHNTLSDCVSISNANAGFCLEGASDNVFQNCTAANNGMSGFYLFRKCDRNRLEKCTAENNKFVGFYLDRQSTANTFVENNSKLNERGFTLNDSSDNSFVKNQTTNNKTYGFWIKNKSFHIRLEDNLAERNQESGFVFSPDCIPSVFEKNQSKNNGAPDEVGFSKTAAFP